MFNSSYKIRGYDERLATVAERLDDAELSALAEEFHTARVEMDRRLEATTQAVYDNLRRGKLP